MALLLGKYSKTSLFARGVGVSVDVPEKMRDKQNWYFKTDQFMPVKSILRKLSWLENVSWNNIGGISEIYVLQNNIKVSNS